MFFLVSTIGLLSFPFAQIPQKAVNNQSLMMSCQKSTESPDIEMMKITLLAREEKTPPVGEPVNPNRDIGFASVFIRLRNLKEANSKITIQDIKIVNIDNGKIQKFRFVPKDIVLHPLENSEQVFHLKNKIGYFDKEPVKAIVTYKIGNLVSQINSKITVVDRP